MNKTKGHYSQNKANDALFTTQNTVHRIKVFPNAAGSCVRPVSALSHKLTAAKTNIIRNLYYPSGDESTSNL